MRKWIASVAMATSTALLAPAFAGDDSTAPATDSNVAGASLELSGGAVAAGIGYVWGDGSFTFAGQQHQFTMSGVTIVDVGATRISATGEVYHLKNLSDFDGNYVALSAGAAALGGADAHFFGKHDSVVLQPLHPPHLLRSQPLA